MTETSHPIHQELRHGGGLLHITLDAPKANILDAAMIGAIGDCLDEHAGSHGIKLVVFEGRGAHFCFGASVDEHRAERAPAMLQAFHGMLRKISSLALPTAAIVRGQCLGGGLELAAFCSWIFADEGARFGQPEIRLAVFPPMASVLLPWRVGGGNAVDLCVSGRTIGAQRALEMGLVSHVGADPSAALDSFYLDHLDASSASSLRFAERAARVSLDRALDRDLPEVERLYINELMKTHDANEGISAFLEKRPPAYGQPPSSETQRSQ